MTTSSVHPNLNGFEVSGADNATSWLGVVADFSANYGTSLGAPVHLQTYLFGPQVRFPGRVSPCACVLVGGAHETIATMQEVFDAGTPNSFARRPVLASISGSLLSCRSGRFKSTT